MAESVCEKFSFLAHTKFINCEKVDSADVVASILYAPLLLGNGYCSGMMYFGYLTNKKHHVFVSLYHGTPTVVFSQLGDF